MVPEPSISTKVDERRTDDRSSTAVNALIGAVVGVVLSFVPGSPALGGGVAGYLEGGAAADRARVGAIAGALMLVPQALFGFFVFAVFLGAGGPGAIGLLLLFFLAAIAVYTIGLSALGGALSGYVEDEL